MLLSIWRGSATGFDGFTGTRPVQELQNVGWTEVCDFWCPAAPVILTEKDKGKYGVPCALKEGPLIGKTLEGAKKNGFSIIGKMRSKTHGTDASMLTMDVDGIPADEFAVRLEKIKADGLTYKAYTTFSHGSIMKPGVRARLLIPIDGPVSVEEYPAVWHGFDKLYFDGKIGKADASGSKLTPAARYLVLSSI